MSPEYHFNNQTGFYRGKVRDVYSIGDHFLVMKASNRLSAFDHILPKEIPGKGQVLNQTAWFFLEATRHIIPNWAIACPFGNITFGLRCEPIPIEMVVRGYLDGHASRLYNDGIREVCGVQMPEGLKKYEAFHQPILTPTTKAKEGHDEDISAHDIIENGIVQAALYEEMQHTALALFAHGSAHAKSMGLILADTKYEFGLHQGKLCLMDEIHTPDSSRYYLLDGYEKSLQNGETPPQLSKEFIRQWLISKGFMGKEGQSIPDMPHEQIEKVRNQYIRLFEQVTGSAFNALPDSPANLVENEINALVKKQSRS
jgi:phosphoribosylaminoimidazole-succinocarboxamide synthase